MLMILNCFVLFRTEPSDGVEPVYTMVRDVSPKCLVAFSWLEHSPLTKFTFSPVSTALSVHSLQRHRRV